MTLVKQLFDSNFSEAEQIFQMTTQYDGDNSTLATNVLADNLSTAVPDATGDSEEDIWLSAANTMTTTEMFVACVAFLFNTANIFAIISSRLHYKITYRLLISLALADAIIALTYGFSDICDKVCSTDSIPVKNVIVYNIYQISSMSCEFTYAVISLDLFAQIILPFKYRSMKGCFKVVLILIWIVPVIFVEGIQIGITLSHMEANEAFLDTYFRLKDNTLFYTNLGLTFVCFILIICLNLPVFCAVYSLMKRSPGEGRSARKSAIVIVAIVASYVIFYTPSWLSGIAFLLHYRFDVPVLESYSMNQRQFITALVTLLKMLNTLVDPLIYVFRIPEVRKTYKNCILRLRNRNNPECGTRYTNNSAPNLTRVF